MPQTELTDHIIKTYQATRRGLAYIGFAFPVLLLIGGLIVNLHLQGSMSAYYHAPPILKANEVLHPGNYVHPGEGVMRNWFVGLLFVIGIILFLYKGFTRMEDHALNLAGVLALGVALFPMPWGDQFKAAGFTLAGVKLTVHGACAVTLFLCIAYVCIFRASDTLGLVKPAERQKRYRLTYKILGWAMVASPVTAFVLSSVFQQHDAYTFFIEMAGVWVFAAYWLIKSREIAETDADRKAACGQLDVPQHKVASHLFKEVNITDRQDAVSVEK